MHCKMVAVIVTSCGYFGYSSLFPFTCS